ncbi:MAG TPA: GntR family transcriptional regulator [Symbiobacteriaceae bacterium]|nr:GntR family transcriptional regulator [Symbiobacteriaceae bacterium]
MKSISWGPIQPTAIRDIVYELLRKGIIAGEIRPEERLIEAELAQRLNISRTPLREAIQKLEQQGWVKRLPSGGVQVTAVQAQELPGLYGIRSVLEGYAAREAAGKTGSQLSERLQDILAEAAKHSEREETEQVGQYGKLFHQTIIEATGNSLLIDFLKTTIDRIDRYRVLGLAGNPHRHMQSHVEHTDIFNAIVAGKAEEAERLMRAHISEGWTILFNRVSELTRPGDMGMPSLSDCDSGDSE